MLPVGRIRQPEPGGLDCCHIAPLGSASMYGVRIANRPLSPLDSIIIHVRPDQASGADILDQEPDGNLWKGRFAYGASGRPDLLSMQESTVSLTLPEDVTSVQNAGPHLLAVNIIRYEAYGSSQGVRKRVESIFGWMKTVGGFQQSRHVGLERTRLCGELVATGYNLVRISRWIVEREAEVPV